MSPVTTPPPRSTFRRFERWMMGVVMGIGAFFIEKLVMRAIRKEGGPAPRPSEGTPIQSKGSDIEGPNILGLDPKP
jgi:hypothetical protein